MMEPVVVAFSKFSLRLCTHFTDQIAQVVSLISSRALPMIDFRMPASSRTRGRTSDLQAAPTSCTSSAAKRRVSRVLSIYHYSNLKHSSPARTHASPPHWQALSSEMTFTPSTWSGPPGTPSTPTGLTALRPLLGQMPALPAPAGECTSSAARSTRTLWVRLL